MKIIEVEYMSNGNYIENYDKPYVIDDESGICVRATFPQGESGSVRAYIGGSGTGDVVDCGTISVSARTAQVILTDDNLAQGLIIVGFEVNTGAAAIRYRPLKLKVNQFVDPTGSNPHGYTVTVSVGTVTSLPAGSAPTVENVGTGKDVVLNFGIPKGDKGDSADVVDNLTSTDTDKALSANQGKVLDGKKVDKVSGKGLSTNDFTNAHKAAVDCMEYNVNHEELEVSKRLVMWNGAYIVNGDVRAASADGTHQLSKKADAPTIQTAVTNNTLLLADKTETQLLSSDTASLTLTTPATIPNSYECAFSFKSGATETTLVYAATPITWRGTDCDADGDFTPQANVSYEVSIKCLGTDADNNPVVVARVGAF